MFNGIRRFLDAIILPIINGHFITFSEYLHTVSIGDWHSYNIAKIDSERSIALLLELKLEMSVDN